jgi:hypothetical protein
MRRYLLPALLLTSCASAAYGSETVTYGYDVLGRLTYSAKQAGPADGTLTTITLRCG